MATNTLIPTQKSQDAILQFSRAALASLNGNFNLRQQYLEQDLAYYREQDRTKIELRAKAANTQGNANALRNITIPVVMPQVDAALSYLSDLFLSSYPIFPIVSKPELDEIALQMETLIGDQGIRFGYVPELLMAIRDGLKHNISAVEVDWDRMIVPSITSQPYENITRGTAVDTYYEGNRIKRLDPYNLIVDRRVAPSVNHIHGEFAGYTEMWNRTQLQTFFAANSQFTMNATKAYESNTASFNLGVSGSDAYYIPEVNAKALLVAGFDATSWLSWCGLEQQNAIAYKGMYEVTTLYARLVPKEFGLDRGGIPRIYKLVIINRSVLVLCKVQSNAHNFLPIITSQLIEDGLGWQTKSFADNAVPMQQAASALYNSAMESQRRKVYDRLLYNPSAINKADIDNVDSVGRIPIKAQAYGQPLSNAIYQIPYRDEGVASVLAFSRDIADMADMVNGQNRAARGQFQKGNKSRAEFSTVMDRSDSRMATMALFMEHRFFQPLKEIIKLNILQYQLPQTLYNRSVNKPVEIDPSQLRTAAIEFRVADGVLPTSKLIGIDAFQGIMQMAMANPQISQEYDIMGMMAHYLQLTGSSWVKDFKRAPMPTTQPGATPVPTGTPS
jgi:hypothetical protein